MSRVYTIVKAHVKTWFRSKSTIFWTLAFPLLLIVLFGESLGQETPGSTFTCRTKTLRAVPRL